MTLTYNHDEYILEHLESLKYQVKKHGKNKDIQFVVCDDHSSDNTIDIIDKWLNINTDLFDEVKIIINNSNRGIVKNYLNGINSISGDSYKWLAGDDLYYKYNIFNVLGDFDLVLTPVLIFNKTILHKDIYENDLFMIKYFGQIEKYLKYKNLFNAPGAFVKFSIINEGEYKKFISKYKWIEDLPTWWYLFFKRSRCNYKYYPKPFVLYRYSQGLSSGNSHSEYYKHYLKERKQIFKEYNLKLFKYPKYFNPYVYYFKYLNLKIKYFDSKYDTDMDDFVKTIKEERIAAEKFLDMIRNNVAKTRKKLKI